MCESGIQTQEQQEYLYWEVYQAMGNLYGTLPWTFVEFCQKLDRMVQNEQ